jgi:hypothetical protein
MYVCTLVCISIYNLGVKTLTQVYMYEISYIEVKLTSDFFFCEQKRCTAWIAYEQVMDISCFSVRAFDGLTTIKEHS